VTEEATIRTVTWDQGSVTLSQLRRTVFMEEQGVPPELEWDGEDADACHVIATLADGTPAGTARMLEDGHIGRLCVLAPFRHRGIGRALLRALLERAAERGMGRVFLHAQVQALGFYQAEGFHAEGPEFLDAGIPHRYMFKQVHHPPGTPGDGE